MQRHYVLAFCVLIRFYLSHPSRYAEIVYDNKQSAIQNFAEIHFTSAPKNSTSTATNVRQMQKTVVISMEPIFDEYGLPICLVCTFTPVDVTMSTLLSKRREQSD